MKLQLRQSLLDETFASLRSCGAGRRECQSLWVGPWSDPSSVTRLVHPDHSASIGGFRVNDAWLTSFLNELADAGEGVRVQVHTHPGAAYHSAIDDAFPFIFVPGFLSLVIPHFAQGLVGFDHAFLAQVGENRVWGEVPICDHLEVL